MARRPVNSECLIRRQYWYQTAVQVVAENRSTSIDINWSNDIGNDKVINEEE